MYPLPDTAPLSINEKATQRGTEAIRRLSREAINAFTSATALAVYERCAPAGPQGTTAQPSWRTPPLSASELLAGRGKGGGEPKDWRAAIERAVTQVNQLSDLCVTTEYGADKRVSFGVSMKSL